MRPRGGGKIVFELPPLHPSQQKAFELISQPSTRYVNLVCGTKWGKTTFGAIWLSAVCLREQGIRRWIAPIYKQTMLGWRACQSLLAPIGVEFRRGDMEARFPNGSILEFRSGEHPETLLGEGVTECVIDEAGLCKEDVWSNVRTTLTATRGKCLRIGTPKGRNWFWRAWQKGCDPLDKTAASLRCLTSDNPVIASEEIEQARREIPDAIFRQEYLAEFVDDEDIVFPNFRACLKDRGEIIRGPDPGGRYVAGVDLAKSRNYTVVTIFDRANNEMVFFDRFHRMPWPAMQNRIGQAADRYGAEVMLDSTGIGDPILDAMRSRSASRNGASSARFRGFQFTSRSKQQIFENLQVMIENEDIKLANVPELVSEFESFTYVYDHRSRSIKYGPAEGSHDDIVDSVALAAYGLARQPAMVSSRGPYG